MAIRYDKQFKNEIYKAVRSFNAKITRLEKKGVSAALLPDRISTKSLKANYTNRKAMRAELKKLQEFTSKGQTFKSEGGVTGTTMLFEYNKKRANKAAKQLQGELNALEQIPTRYPMMKSESATLLENKIKYLKRDIYKLDIKQINIFIRNTEVTNKYNEKNAIFHENFNKMFMAMAYAAGLDRHYIERIQDKLNRISPNELLELYRTNPAFKMVTEKYKKSQEEDEAKAIYDAIEARIDEILAQDLSDEEALKLIKEAREQITSEFKANRKLEHSKVYAEVEADIDAIMQMNISDKEKWERIQKVKEGWDEVNARRKDINTASGKTKYYGN